jgi:hypothetical protein
MISDLNKWKIINGIVDTSEGDKIIEKNLKQYKQWKKEHKNISEIKTRKKITNEERKQHIKAYQHNYYLKVTKLKRKGIYDNPELLEQGND